MPRNSWNELAVNVGEFGVKEDDETRIDKAKTFREENPRRSILEACSYCCCYDLFTI